METLSIKRWVALGDAIAVDGDLNDWFNRLVRAYSEPQRHYHNQRHIAECLVEFDLSKHLLLQPTAVEFALWFHDAVYNPKASDNEQQSALLARQFLAEAKTPVRLADTVSRLILATRHQDPAQDSDEALILDIDLSILGKPEPRFLEYEMEIRKEYAWVPWNVFAVERSKILQRFLARKRIFNSDWFYQQYEQPARRNIQQSLTNLRSHRNEEV